MIMRASAKFLKIADTSSTQPQCLQQQMIVLSCNYRQKFKSHIRSGKMHSKYNVSRYSTSSSVNLNFFFFRSSTSFRDDDIYATVELSKRIPLDFIMHARFKYIHSPISTFTMHA